MKKMLFNIMPLFMLFFVAIFCFSEAVKAQEISLQENLNLDEALAAEVTVDAIDVNETHMAKVAQPLQRVKTLTGSPQIEAMLRRIISKKVKVDLRGINSLFFTQWESNLLSDARKGFVARPADDKDVEKAERDLASGIALPRGPREIAIGGIIYRSANNWTVWINGKQIQPDRIPTEILDIQVSKDYVKLKWFDAFSNQIFPIKLKTHQRFNIDTRIFLPG